MCRESPVLFRELELIVASTMVCVLFCLFPSCSLLLFCRRRQRQRQRQRQRRRRRRRRCRSHSFLSCEAKEKLQSFKIQPETPLRKRSTRVEDDTL